MAHSKHKHHRSKAHVDVEKQRVRLGSETYRRDSMDDGYGGVRTWWSRVSKTKCKKDLKEVPFVPEEKRNHERHDWGDALRFLDSDKRKDRHLIRKLDRALNRALREAEKRAKGETAKLEDVLAMEEAVDKIQYPESADEKPRQKSASAEVGQIKRDKHGVRLFSNDGKHFFNIGVYNSRKVPGSSTVCIFAAGQALTYTLGKKEMEALFREVTRTFSVKDLRRLVENSRPT